MVSVTPYRDWDSCESLRLVWTKLLGETRGGSCFQSLDWLTIYRGYFSPDAEPLVLVIRDAARPVGLVPLVRERRRSLRRTRRVLRYPLPADGPYFFGPVGAQATVTGISALGWLRQHTGDWDLLQLDGVNRSEMDFGRTADALSFARLRGKETRDQEWGRLATPVEPSPDDEPSEWHWSVVLLGPNDERTEHASSPPATEQVVEALASGVPHGADWPPAVWAELLATRAARRQLLAVTGSIGETLVAVAIAARYGDHWCELTRLCHYSGAAASRRITGRLAAAIESQGGQTLWTPHVTRDSPRIVRCRYVARA